MGAMSRLFSYCKKTKKIININTALLVIVKTEEKEAE